MDNLRAMGLMCVAMAFFAGNDAFIKQASTHMPIGQIIVILGIAGSFLFWLLCVARGTPVLTRAFFHPVVIARNLGEMIGAAGMIAALALAPLSTVSAIQQSMPLFVTMCAALFLREKVGLRRWSAVIVGFVGVIIIIQPTTDGIAYSALLALVGSMGLAVRDLASRMAPQDVTTPQLALYAFVATIFVGLAMMPFSEGPVAVEWPAARSLLGALCCVFVGYLSITKSMRMGEVSAVSPIRYTRLPFAACIGIFAFGESLDAATLLGSAIVICAGLYIMAREARVFRKKSG